MIAASEPLEFVPHGRTVVANHPSQIYGRGHHSSGAENSLLYKLTNFAIKDESLLETKDEDQEWWCIREVYYKDGEDFDDDPQVLNKDQNSDYSESFRPVSRLKSEFNVSIKQELLSAKKGSDCNSGGTSRTGSANSSSNLSKKFNLSSGQGRSPNRKPFNPKTDSSYEEELYVKGCTVVWSKGLVSTPATKLSSPEHRETISCFTIENPIKLATFANFHISINNTMLIDALNSQIGDTKKNIKIEDTTEHIQSKIMPSILLIDSKCMRVYATDGREYVTSIPFQVKKVWPMKYGVLLEKNATPLLHNSFLPMSINKLNESHNSSFSKSKNFPLNMSAKLRAESVSGYDQDVPLPTCFSLSHPLDEVTPVLMKSPTQGLQYYNDGDTQIIFVSTNPSIILLYDWKLNIHTLWKIRKALRDECLYVCPNMNSTTTVFSQSCDFIGSPMQSQAGKNTTNWVTGVSSPLNTRKGFGTPTMSRSRINSPMANVFHQQGLSPHASIGQASSMSMIANTMTQAPPSLPLYPDVCLDHIWTDSQAIVRDTVEHPNDTKAFLHTDLIGLDYLCFMVKTSGISKLHIVRLQKSHSHGQSSKTNLIVGAVSVVFAKDAVVLDHLKMIALIDESGNIILQSGNHVVGKDNNVQQKKTHSCEIDLTKNTVLLEKEKLKNEAKKSDVPITQIYKNAVCEMEDSGLNFVSEIPKFTNVKSALYKVRHQAIGAKKTVFHLLKEVEIPEIHQDFLLCDIDYGESRILVFCSTESKLLLEKTKDFFVDATFHSCPKPFYQLLSIHGDFGSTDDTVNTKPLIYALMPDKKQDTYVALFDTLQKNLPIEIKTVHCDFEAALYNALSAVFPMASIKGCYYHWTRNMWKKAKLLNHKTKDKRRIVGLCAVLPLLPHDCLLSGWEYIQTEYQESGLEMPKFIKYVRRLLKKPGYLKMISVFGLRHRTNNVTESFHSKLNKYLNKGVTLLRLLNVLKKNEKFSKLQTHNQRSKTVKNRDAIIRNILMGFINGDTTIGHALEKLR